MTERSQTHRMKTFEQLVQQSGDAEAILRSSTGITVGKNVVQGAGVVVRVDFLDGSYDRAVCDPYALGSFFEAANRLGRSEPRFQIVATEMNRARTTLTTALGAHTL
jgi:hypothetical protein